MKKNTILLSLLALLFCTTAAKAQWETVLQDAGVSCIKVVSPDTIYAGGKDKVIRSTDWGEHWDSLHIDLKGQWVENFDFVSAQTGYFHTTHRLYKTTDYGVSWNLLDTNVFKAYILRNIDFINKDTGWLLAETYPEKQYIFRTHDGGNSWDTTRFNYEYKKSLYDHFEIQMLSKNDGYAIIADSLIKTANGGDSWELPNIYHTKVASISFISEQNGFAIFYDNGNPALFCTNDGGYHWDYISYGIGGLYTKLRFLGPDTAYCAYDLGIVGNYGSIFVTSLDGGYTWDYKGAECLDFDMHNSAYGFRIARYEEYAPYFIERLDLYNLQGNITDEPIKKKISVFTHYQSKALQIQFPEGNTINETLFFELYNSQGKLCLSKELHKSRSQSIAFPPHLAKGIYIYKISSENQSIQSGKILLSI